jgi:predicted phosphodiesterase
VKILILSDLHLEFDDWKKQKAFITSLDHNDIDVLVLAGDICLYKQIFEVMSLFCKKFENVIWVHGNHEFYMTDRSTVIARTQEAVQQNKNLHWLDCSAIEIKGQRFIGTPLWFPKHDINAQFELRMNDFHVIHDFKKWVYDENIRAVDYIKNLVKQDDVVITHHLPSRRSIAAQYSHSELNNFFLCDMEQFIKNRGPKFWIHGHTHTSFDYEIQHEFTLHKSRIICNPRGYNPHDLNPDFNKGLVIEL